MQRLFCLTTTTCVRTENFQGYFYCHIIAERLLPIGRKRGRECTGSESRAYSVCSQVALPLRYRKKKITNSTQILWRRQFGNNPCTVLTSRGYHPIGNAQNMYFNFITLTFYLTVQCRNIANEY